MNILRKNQRKYYTLRTKTVMNNGFDDLSSRVDTAEETISKLEDR